MSIPAEKRFEDAISLILGSGRPYVNSVRHRLQIFVASGLMPVQAATSSLNAYRSSTS
jgi:hypothetical protein